MKRFTVNLRDGSVFVIDAEFVLDDVDSGVIEFTADDEVVALVSRADMLTIRVEQVAS